MTGPSTVDGVSIRGRGRELSILSKLSAAAQLGNGGALLVHGESGIGRTAVLTATASAAMGDFLVLATSGYERERTLPYAGLQRLLHFVPERSARLPNREATLLARAFEGQGVEGAKLTLATAVLRMLTDASRDRPVLCCIDDAQWLDPDSLDVLSYLSRRIGSRRVAIAFSSCDSVIAPTELRLGVSTLRLPPLDRDASQEMLNDLVPAGLVGDVAASIADLAGGNPRALADLAHALTPEQASGDVDLPTCLPPESPLRTSYETRLGRLPAEARWLVLLAAADDELDVTELVRAAAAAGVDIAALEPAELAMVVHIAGSEVVFPQPLIRAIAYDAATFAQRRAAHRLLAKTIDPSVHPLRQLLHVASTVDGQDDELATALRCAVATPGPTRAAGVRALRRAAELTTEPSLAAADLVTAARLAWESGQPHRARILLRRIPATSAGFVAAEAALLLGEIDLRCGPSGDSGRPARPTVTLSEEHPTLTRVLRAGEALLMSGDCGGYAELIRRAATGTADPQADSTLLRGHFAGMDALFKGDYRTAEPQLRQVVREARDRDDPVALTLGTMAAILLGDNPQAYGLAVRAAAVARTDGDVAIVPQALELVAVAEFGSGRYQSATATLSQALSLARASGQQNLATSVLACLALLASFLGDEPTCTRRVREAQRNVAGHGMHRTRALIHWALGALNLAIGRPNDALARLRNLTTPRAGRKELVIRVAASPQLVEAAVRSGEPRSAVVALHVFNPWAAATGDPAWLALAARCRALLSSDVDQAERHFNRALELHAAADADFDRARTELLYGQELRRARRPSAAREHLRSALETFRRFDAQPWIEQATVELRATGGQVAHRGVDIAETLTPQQLQIARLAAAGATNREVAAHLFISPRTVDYHMRNIFVRLGIRSRFELARLVQ